jgi:hypothetical protein
MEREEFNDWLTKHQKAYPALGDWFATLPDTKGTLQIWFDVMKELTKENAIEATMRMIRGVEPIVKYTNWHDTPRFVVEHSQCVKRESGGSKFVIRRVDGEPVYACVRCFDSGVVEVYHGREVHQIRKGQFGGKLVHSAARACGCDLSKRKYAGLIEKGELKVYEEGFDVLLPSDTRCCAVDTRDADIELIASSIGASVGPIDSSW